MDESLQSSVLIVDDSRINIRLVSKMIEDLGLEIYTASSGVEALKILTQVKPSVILLDIRMPKMDGFDFCRRVKKSSSRASIPIIFMSGSNDNKDMAKAKTLGGKGYLTKPIDATALKKEIEFHMPWASV